jgi:ribosomal protein L11 methyltransferase
VGCGSGILSLAALTLGVDTAVAVDIDAQAVEATQHNARLNALHERLHCVQGSVDDVVGQFAWILANIYLGPLIEMLPLFRRRLAPAGTVVLSGILGSQEETLRERLTNAGFVVRQRGEDTGWVALAVQRREDVGCIASV